jgi:hypothetical protein
VIKADPVSIPWAAIHTSFIGKGVPAFLSWLFTKKGMRDFLKYLNIAKQC